MSLINYEWFDDSPVATAEQPCPKDPPPKVSKVLKGYFALKLEGDPPKGKTGPVKVDLVRTESAIVGAKLWLVIETSDLKGGEITVEILGGADATIVVKDAALTVMEDGTAKTSLKAKVGNWSTDTNISNAADYANKAIICLEVKPDTDEKTKTWRTDIGKTKDKKAEFYLKVTATGGNETEYAMEDDVLKGPDKERSLFLNKKDGRFMLYACFCEKKLTPADLRVMNKDKKLFTVRCPLPADKKNYEDFCTELNAAMKAHSINTCLRKAHFLAQIQAETDWFNTTVEYASGDDYDKFTHEADYKNYNLYLEHLNDKENPFLKFGTKEVKRGWRRYSECDRHGHTESGDGRKYKGRGLIQITWKDTYESYFEAISKTELIDTPENVGSDLQLACNSAAWYWTSRSRLGNLNRLADNDDLMAITLGVNGSVHEERTHYDKRKENLLNFFEFMKTKDSCQSANGLSKTIGIYKLSASAAATDVVGRSNKKSIEKLDD